MPTLTIDGRTAEFEPGATILDAARATGVEIPTLCHLPGRPPQTSCFVCVVRVQGTTRLVPSCATAAVDGMTVASDDPDVRDARRTAIELLLSDHLGDCVGPCQSVCPAHMDIPDMMRDITAGRFREALMTVKERIALPAVLGRICPELCEKGCRRAATGGAVAVCGLKRFVAEHDLASEDPYIPPLAPATGKRVAIIGAGPAGLSAAYYLLRAGHACALFDDHAEPGGALRYAIPEETLPKATLDAEIDIVRRMGAEMHCGVRVGRDITLDEIRASYDSVIIATGPLSPDTVPAPELTLGPQGVRTDRRRMTTSLEGVFAAGSAIVPARHAVRAVADGRAAAEAVDRTLAGDPGGGRDDGFSVHIGKLELQDAQTFVRLKHVGDRVAAARGPAAGFSAAEAQREASRCLECDCSGARTCRLRQFAGEYEANPVRFRGERRPYERDETHPDIVFEPGKCIACGICVRIAAEAGEQLGVGFVGRGFTVRMAAPFDARIAEGLRDTARRCAEACPTAALALRGDGEGR